MISDSNNNNPKMNAKELRAVDDGNASLEMEKVERNEVIFILENVYDTYNIGGLFRLADALCVKRMYLCGEMETPPNARILKASIGTYKVVPWVYKENAKEAIKELREEYQNKIQVMAVEQDNRSKPLTDVSITGPMALILGNETFGVTPETLALADEIVEIPMWGINKSLNVIVSGAIVGYWMMLNKGK